MSPIMEQKQMNGNVATDDVRWNPYSKKYVKKLKLQTQQSKLTQTTFKLKEMHDDGNTWIGDDLSDPPDKKHTRVLLHNCNSFAKYLHDPNLTHSVMRDQRRHERNIRQVDRARNRQGKVQGSLTNWIVGIRQDTARTPQTSVTREGDVLTTSTNMSNTVNNDTGDTRDIQENDVLLELEEEFVEHIAESRMENAREDFEEECSYLYGNIEDDDFFSLSHQPWS